MKSKQVVSNNFISVSSVSNGKFYAHFLLPETVRKVVGLSETLLIFVKMALVVNAIFFFFINQVPSISFLLLQILLKPPEFFCVSLRDMQLLKLTQINKLLSFSPFLNIKL